jgi:hypothetical protein
MTLTGELALALGRQEARSFELMGEGLALLTGPRLGRAAAVYAAELERVPAALRGEFEQEQQRIVAEAHTWLRRYNRSVHTRLRGYLALGRSCGFSYPWPVVAMLGICQVMSGLARSHAYALVGIAARRLRFPALEELAEGTEDVLRRTNRGIFADSVPTVLYALRCAELSAGGRPELAGALLDGPLPPIMDEESRAIARELAARAGEPESPECFRSLAALTREHFAREQQIFTHHIGVGSGRPPDARGLVARLVALTEVPAPAVVATARGREFRFRRFRLPPGFDVRDHEARVEAFARAFVDSVTASEEDYRAAVAYVEHRFGRPA